MSGQALFNSMLALGAWAKAHDVDPRDMRVVIELPDPHTARQNMLLDFDPNYMQAEPSRIAGIAIVFRERSR